MWTAFKTLLAVLGFMSLVPLIVWAGTGNWRHALHALREYLIAMAFICVPALVLGLLVAAAELIR